MESKNLAKIQEVYKLLRSDSARGVERLFELLADDIRWSSAADESIRGLEFGTTRESKSEVEAYFREVANKWEVLEINIDHYTAQADRVIVCGEGVWKSRKTGKIVRTRKVDVYRLKDGKIIEFSEFFDTAAVVAAAAS